MTIGNPFDRWREYRRLGKVKAEFNDGENANVYDTEVVACPDCGCAVVDYDRHDQFHVALDRLQVAGIPPSAAGNPPMVPPE